MPTPELRSLAETLRAALARPLPGTGAQDAMRPAFRVGEAPPDGLRPSAVLIALVDGEAGPALVLIERAVGGLHGGQFAFPGGGEEDGDGGPVGTALREAREEIGLENASVEVLGLLTPLTITVSRFLVRPVVGLVAGEVELVPNPAEVAAILRVGVGELLDPGNKAEREILVRGERRTVPCYLFGAAGGEAGGGALVWGATAMILSEFESILLGAEFEAVARGAQD